VKAVATGYVAARTDGVILESRHACLRIVFHGYLERRILTFGHLEFANILDTLIILDGPAAVRAVGSDRLAESLVQLRH